MRAEDRTSVSMTIVVQESGARLDLHSFPTRRSSDLRRRKRGNYKDSRGGIKNRVPISERPSVVDIGTLRSEEHTSELQSRPHLVCRLLLEKKNQRYFVQAA